MIEALTLLTDEQRTELDAWFCAELRAIGGRHESAAMLQKRNEEHARTAWMEHIPRDPNALVVVLREAGVDLDELKAVLR